MVTAKILCLGLESQKSVGDLTVAMSTVYIPSTAIPVVNVSFMYLSVLRFHISGHHKNNLDLSKLNKYNFR